MKSLHLLLQRLADAGLEFVVVGGFAGVLHAPPMSPTTSIFVLFCPLKPSPSCERRWPI